MNHDEIRALLADCEDERHLLGRNTGINVPKLCNAIESLLAREAEVLKQIKNAHTLSRDDNVNMALWNLLQEIRAILNPERKT